MTRIFLHVTVKDPMSGFFAVRKSAFNSVKTRLSPRGFKIMLEMLYLLTNSGKPCRVSECGITFNKRIHGQSKLSMKVS
jgi:dolichol-phosphate mannosyltransferase